MSTPATIPLFGRSYNLQVLTPADGGGGQQLITYSTSSWEPEALRISFDVEKRINQFAWYADIDIYNLSASAEQSAIQVGSQVILSAGYQDPSNYGIIFSGQVLQPTWERINATDYKVGLRCIIGTSYLNGNIVSANIARLSTQADAVRRMAAQAHKAFATDLIDFSSMNQSALPRGQVFFGDVGSFLSEIATENGAQFWSAGDRPAYAKPNSDIGSATPDVTYAPRIPDGSTFTPKAGTTYSIIGTPQQTQAGVDFRVLLDPRISFRKGQFTVCKLDMTQIRQLPISVGGGLIAPFEQTGQYYVAGVRHVGDSRGNEWYSEITAVTPNGLAYLGF